MERGLRACRAYGFWLMAAGCVAGLTAETLGLVRLRATAEQAQARLAQARLNLQRLQSLSPSPSTANVDLSEQGWTSARRALADIRDDGTQAMAHVLSEEEPAGTAKRAGAFFDLARFVDDLTERCLAEEIEIPDGLRFGFASHASVAPAVELIPLLTRQSVAVEDLMTALISAGPQRIESVRRERPVVPRNERKGLAAAPSEPGATLVSGDFFVPEAETSVADSLGLEALSFRVGFVGTTACLRRFLNALAQGEAPWCVTMIDVQPEKKPRADANLPPERRRADRDGNFTQDRPYVQPTLSRFVVTLEWAQPGSRDRGGLGSAP